MRKKINREMISCSDMSDDHRTFKRMPFPLKISQDFHYACCQRFTLNYDRQMCKSNESFMAENSCDQCREVWVGNHHDLSLKSVNQHGYFYENKFTRNLLRANFTPNIKQSNALNERSMSLFNEPDA
jgi:hypothetical protein